MVMSQTNSFNFQNRSLLDRSVIVAFYERIKQIRGHPLAGLTAFQGLLRLEKTAIGVGMGAGSLPLKRQD